MADREKVIKGLECCTRGDVCFSDCPYFKEVPMADGRCITAVQADALALLKEQEPVKPMLAHIGNYAAINDYTCPVCKSDLYHLQKYCDECGRQVKWE